MSLDRHVAERLDALAPRDARLCVGFSGGLDSLVLLDVMARLGKTRKESLTAVHVHHGLSPNADKWADFCREACAERGVSLDVERVRIDRSSPDGLEGAARAARYAVYAARPENHVVLAHHLEDQSETVLLQLLRGAGVKGIAAMPELRRLTGSNVQLVRPLLGVARASLHAWAEDNKLRWIDDESNASLRHDRNYLRHQVAPHLDERFPGWRPAVARFARNAGTADALLRELANIDGLPNAPGEDLPVDPNLSADRRGNLLRCFLALNNAPMPTEARLAEMGRQLFSARGDTRVRIEHEDTLLLRFRDRVRIEHLATGVGRLDHPWNGEREVVLDAGYGLVRFEPAAGEGLLAERSTLPGWRFGSRVGGERLRPDARGPNRTLKNLLQEHDVPPWERQRMPLLFHRDRLVWAPEIGIDADYACPPGAPGLRPTWVRNPPAASQQTRDVLK